MVKKEKRTVGLIEARKIGDNKPPILVGYCARYNSPTEIGDVFIEQIAPGAFSKSISEDDVRALFNHNPDYVLGRNRSGTLKLSEDDQGLWFDVTPPDTTWAKDLVESVSRGDITQCSFSFDALQEDWDFSGTIPTRTLKQCRLYDVSPAVTFPAYPDTSVAVRSLDQAKADLELARRRSNFNAASLRIKLKNKLDFVRRSLSV